ncbi:hypothetical protein [Selenomonas noxia]
MNERVLGAGFNESYFETINAMEKPKGLNYEELNQVAKSLDMEREKVRSAGEDFDRISGAWKEYEPTHQAISDGIQALHQIPGNTGNPSEEYQDIIRKATSLLKEGEDFFRKENDLVYGEIKKLNQNLEEISTIIAAIKERDIRRLSPDKVMDAVKHGLELQNEFKAITAEILKQQKQENRIEEIKKASEYLKEKLEQVKQIPSMIKKAIEREAYEAVDKSLLKVSSVFDKGINELQQQRDLIKGLSPRLKNEMEKIAAGKPLKNVLLREQGGMSR